MQLSLGVSFLTLEKKKPKKLKKQQQASLLHEDVSPEKTFDLQMDKGSFLLMCHLYNLLLQQII